MSKCLVVIAGPTAVGKTDLSIRLAQFFQTEIISADSRQFYRELNIGTAKPDPLQLEVVPHHFINTHSIQEDFNVFDYEKQASILIERLFKLKPVLILTGGTGLYIKAVCEGLDEMPVANEEIREKLNEQLSKDGIHPLQEKLKELDPELFRTMDINNPQRLIRALEICLTSGSPASKLRKGEKEKRPYSIVKIGLNLEREILYERINKRVDLMIDKGLVEEAKVLYNYRNKNALQTVGYKELFDFFEKKLSLQEAIEKIKQNTRNYAKRQLTWFRKDKEFKWFNPDQEDDILKYLREQCAA